MIIPQSSLEPFGVIDWPTVQPEWDNALNLREKLWEMVNDHRISYVSPSGLHTLLRMYVIKNGAHSAFVGSKRLSDGEVIFKIRFQMTPHGKIHKVYPSYYPKTTI